MPVRQKHKTEGAVLGRIMRHPDYIPPYDHLDSPKGLLDFYKFNDYIAVHIKYGQIRDFGEYTFEYTKLNWVAMQFIGGGENTNLWLTLHCLDADEICPVKYQELLDLIERGGGWARVLYVEYNGNNLFRVYVNGKSERIERPMVVRVKDFPKRLFEEDKTRWEQ